MSDWREASRSLSERPHGTYARRYVGRGHRLADRSGMAYEHRLIAADRFGIRALRRRGKGGTHVHHVDGGRRDDPKARLAPIPASVHARLPRAARRRV